MRRALFLMACLLLAHTPHAVMAQKVVDISGSIDALLASAEAGAIVNSHVTRFEVRAPDKARLHVTKEVTILDRSGRDHGILSVYYDKLRRLRKFSGDVRDQNGRVVAKLGKGSIEDRSAIDGSTLYADTRVKVGTLMHDKYPYTISFNYEIEYEGVSHWPTWYPQETRAPVLFSVFQIVVPDGMPVRYRAQHFDTEPTINSVGRRTEYRWEVGAMAPFEPEPWGPTFREQVPAVFTAPTQFEVDGYVGDMSSWAGLAQWYNDLKAGRSNVPEGLRLEVLELVAGAPSMEERARRVYAFMQARTRYVSVQLGLGGWQPYDVIYVDKNGFGDCKALVNYAQALLDVAGVEAYPALIHSGRVASLVPADFPCNVFNHVVLYLPNDGNPIWLECTSQTIPFGRIGSSNEDRWALVAFPEGGRLVRTPASSADVNFKRKRGRVTMTATGDATADLTTSYGGNQQDGVRGAVLNLSDADRVAWLHAQIELPSFKVLSSDFTKVAPGVDSLSLPLTLAVPKYAQRTGKRMFFRPLFAERQVVIPPDAVGGRAQPVRFAYRFVDTDTIDYVLPPGYRVEATPEPVALVTKFGAFSSAAVLQDDGALRYTRRFEINETTVAPELFEELQGFYRAVAKHDRGQVVLVQDR